ncbi:MAG TPA: hypothetical protein VGQ93_11490 [Lysobacter sp.]|jgi:hypothetical protein|nr:hypothetical protein [Lysobacter sp.]
MLSRTSSGVSPSGFPTTARLAASAHAAGAAVGAAAATCHLSPGANYLAWAWIETANFAIRFEPAIQRWHQRNAARKPRLVALKAVAHKLARAGYYLLRDGGTSEVHRAFA